ncbi:YhhN-like protein [Thermothelomyces heterothallicus CBS 202.75]|uniref:YhhN-like protein n=1 Tax=Thermothelomyces heterothallicus CBS 202.75 TaxID=1149848 RepID=UPI003742D336
MITILVPRIDQGLRPPVVLYSLTILVMALTALTVDSSRVVAGSLMFSASDAILATDRFLVSQASSHRAWMQPAVWVLYYFGQLLIAVGLLPLS